MFDLDLPFKNHILHVGYGTNGSSVVKGIRLNH